MSGNRDELPERTSGNTEGSSRSRQQESQEAIAERLGIDPSLVATRDTIDQGVEQRLTDEGATAAERQLRQETAADREYVQPADLRADVDPESFAAEATLTEKGQQRAQQRQADQLRSEAAQQSDRFAADDFAVDRSGEEITVEPTEEAVNRERRETAAQQFEGQSQFISDVEPADVNLTDDGAQLDDNIIEQAEQRAQQQAGQQRQPTDQQRQEARQDFAESIESGSAFSDLPDDVDPASLVDDVDPQQDIVREDDSLTLADDVESQINSQLESDALQQQRQEFVDALESGEAFESGKPPKGLGDVDPQQDIAIEDSQLTLADSKRVDLVQSQAQSQIGNLSLPSESVAADDVASDRRAQLLIEGGREIAAETPGLEFQRTQEPLPEDDSAVITPQNLSLDGTEVEVDEVELGEALEDQGLKPGEDGPFYDGGGAIFDRRSRLVRERDGGGFREEDVPVVDAETFFNRASPVDDAPSLDATQDSELRSALADAAAADLDDRFRTVTVDESDVTVSGDGIGLTDAAEDRLQIGSDDISAEGLTNSGRDAIARQQIESIQSQLGERGDISVALAGTEATQLAVDARNALSDPSLGSSNEFLGAAGRGVSDRGIPVGELIQDLDPDETPTADAETVRTAQQQISQAEQQLESNPTAALEELSTDTQNELEEALLAETGFQQGRANRRAVRQRFDDIEQQLAAADPNETADSVDISPDFDGGVRDINQGARDAIQANAAADLPNIQSPDVDVGIDGGSIDTSIEQSAIEQIREQRVATREIQVRNQIADTTEGIDRGDIEVDAGEGVSPSDELVTETLGSDVGGDVDSFDELEAAANIQARQQARQQAIQQVDSQTIGSVDPRNVSVERTSDGFAANVSGAAAQTTNLSAVNASSAVDEAIDLSSGQQNGDEPLVQAGEDLPDSIGEVPGAVAGGGEFVDVNAPTRPPEIRRAVSDTAQDAIGVDIDRNIGRQTLQNVRASGRDIVTGDFDVPDGSPVAGAAGIAVAAPEPVSTGTGAAILGGLALGGAITSFANNQAEIDVPDRTPASGFSEIDIGQTRQEIDEINVPEQTPASDVGEIDIPDRATTDGEIDIPDRTPASGTGEVNIPSIDAAQLIGRGNLVEEEEEEEDETVLGGEDIPINPFENAREQGSTPERFIREDRDAFVIRNPETPQVDQGQAADEVVNDAIDTGVDSDFGTETGSEPIEPIPPAGSDIDTRPGVDVGGSSGTGIDSQFRQDVGETGQQRFFARGRGDIQPGEDIESRLGVDVGGGVDADAGVGPEADTGVDTDTGVDSGVGVGPETGTGIDTDTGVRSDTQTDADTRFDTPTRQQTTTQNTFAEPAVTETVPGFESGFEGRPNRTGRSRRRSRRPNLGVDPDDTETTESPQFQTADDLFDSGILSGYEALNESFNR